MFQNIPSFPEVVYLLNPDVYGMTYPVWEKYGGLSFLSPAVILKVREEYPSICPCQAVQQKKFFVAG
jgi:hypothetical protein